MLLSSTVSIPAGWTDKVEHTWEQAFKSGKGAEEMADVVNEAIQDDVPKDATGGFVQHPSPAKDEHAMSSAGPAVATTSAVQNPSPFPPQDAPLPERIDVAIIESGGTNDETTAGLVHAFGKQPSSHLSLYTLQQRYGIGEIINNFHLAHPLAANRSSDDFEEAITRGSVPDVVVSATCETDLIALDTPLTQLLELKKTYLFCVIHQPERWGGLDLTRRIRPWIDQQLADLVTLSQHTAHYLRTEVINDWDFNATVTVRHLTPLFPVALQDDEFPVSRLAKNEFPTLQYPIAIHGDFDASRHNYTDAFENVLAVKDRAKEVSITTKEQVVTQKREVSLHVFGERLPPDVPKNVKPILSVNREMSYQRQYETLSKSFILLPAFADSDHSDYVHKLASWAIPASLIAGVPIVAGDDILFAYSYLPKDAVWQRYPGRSEMNVVEMVALQDVDEHRKKKDVVKAVCRDIIRRSAAFADEWVQIGMRRVQRHAWREKMEAEEDEFDMLGFEALSSSSEE